MTKRKYEKQNLIPPEYDKTEGNFISWFIDILTTGGKKKRDLTNSESKWYKANEHTIEKMLKKRK